MDGAGATGDMIGTIDIQFMIAKDTTRVATRFITGAITIEGEASVA
jgi:ribosomal protein S28E/S33